jgi:hypothetical protein
MVAPILASCGNSRIFVNPFDAGGVVVFRHALEPTNHQFIRKPTSALCDFRMDWRAGSSAIGSGGGDCGSWSFSFFVEPKGAASMFLSPGPHLAYHMQLSWI